MKLPGVLQRWFDRTWRRGMVASAEALFPEWPGGIDFRQADVIARTEAYVLGLPPTQSPLVQLMFLALEILTPVLSPIGPRFSRRPVQVRLRMIEHWREGWFLPTRLLGDAVRATMVMVYFSHPTVMAVFGEPVDGDPVKADA